MCVPPSWLVATPWLVPILLRPLVKVRGSSPRRGSSPLLIVPTPEGWKAEYTLASRMQIHESLTVLALLTRGEARTSDPWIWSLMLYHLSYLTIHTYIHTYIRSESKREPQTVTRIKNTEIWWDKKVMTQKKIKHDRPDIIIWDKESKHCKIVDVSIPLDTNVKLREQMKRDYYIELIDQLQRIYPTYKYVVIPVILGALGT